MICARRLHAFLLGTLMAASAVGVAAPARATTGSFDPHHLSRSVLSRLVHDCAPEVNAVTQAAIVAVESGGDAWAMHDDNDDRVYSPSSLGGATKLVGALVTRDRALYGSRDRGIDVGLAQINSKNFPALRVTPTAMLDPCENLHASARIIVTAYLHERRLLDQDPSARGDQLALRRALQVYNSGRSSGDDNYVRAIFNAVGIPLVHNDVGIAGVPANAHRSSGARIGLGHPVYLANVITSKNRRTSSHARKRSIRSSTLIAGSALFAHVDAAPAAPQIPVTETSAARTPRDGAAFFHTPIEQTNTGSAGPQDAPSR